MRSLLNEEFTDARTHGRTHDGHNAMTIASWASASGTKKALWEYPVTNDV